MLKKDIQVGGRYLANVSGRPTVVRITGERKRATYTLRGGDRDLTQWTAINEATGRDVLIRSAQRLHGPAR